VVEHRNDEGGVLHSSIFPLNRWINSGDRMSFVEFDSCLPQFDKYSAQRKQELQEMREEYVLVQNVCRIYRLFVETIDCFHNM